MDKNVAIIDLDSAAFAIGWGKKIPNGNGDFQRDEKGRLLYEDKTDEELEFFSRLIMSDILKSCECTSYIGFIKGKNSSAHRYKAKSDYKGNRPKESPKWWNKVKTYLIDNWNVYPVDNIEVDDAVNLTRLRIENSFMVAIDKDLLNLEGTHYNWKTKEWVTVNEEEAFNFFWSDMITGQSGDGVKGLPGKGKAYAKSIEMSIPNVFDEYVKIFGEELGFEEFRKNYTCLKILEECEGFVIPDRKQIKLEKKEEEEIWW